MEKFFHQSYWSSGLSESELIGPKGSFSRAFGVDIHTIPGVIQPSLVPTTEISAGDSGGTLDQLCLVAIDSSTGTSFWFGDGGVIYRRRITSGLVSWGTVYKFGSSRPIRGAAEFRGYYYWAIDRNIKRIGIRDNWATDVSESWGSINSSFIGRPTYNQMVDMGLYLLIASGTTIASIDDTGTLTANGIPNVSLNYLPANYSISTIHKYGIDILAGTRTYGGVKGAKLLRWDLASPTWTQDIDTPEDSINCFLTTNENKTYLQSGLKGKTYEYDGISIKPFKSIQTFDANPSGVYASFQSSANFEGIGYLGITNETTSSIAGLYALGRKNESYPISLCHQFPLSGGSVDSHDIGAVLSGFDTSVSLPWIAFSWRSRPNEGFGVDAIFNTSARVPNAYIETQAISGDRMKQKEFQNYNISYKSKPTNMDITLDYYKNFSAGTTGRISLTDKSNYNNLVSNEKIEAGAMKFRINLIASGSGTPQVDSFYTSWNERDIL